MTEPTPPKYMVLPDGTEVWSHGSMHDPFGDGRTPGPRFDPDPVLDPFNVGNEVAKHGSHDQSNHGNWARGGRSISQDVALRTEVEGGATNRGGSRVRSGKALSINPERSRHYPNGASMNRAAVAAAVQRYREDHADMLNNGYALGTWLDPESGILWLDVITVVSTTEEADTLARQHNQIAYFDIDQGKEVRTGGTGLTKRGLADRLRGWLHPGGGSSAPGQHDGVAGGSDGRGDRGGPGTFDPFGLNNTVKHAGPGAHPSGSPQSVHSGSGSAGSGGAPTVGAGRPSIPSSVPPVEPPVLTQGLQSHPHAPAVQGLLRKIIAAEPSATEDLLTTAVENGGGMAGLEFRFKKPDGLLDKIGRKAREKGIAPEQALAGIDDALRYTMVFPPESYGAAVTEALADLEARGFTSDDVENNWSLGDAYNGINTVVERDGVRMELQFHTPDSFTIKQEAHLDYEMLREGTGTDLERFEAFERMQERTDHMQPLPADVEGIGVSRHRPFVPLGKAIERQRTFVHQDGTVVRFDAKRAMPQALRGGKWTDAAGYITSLLDPMPGDRMSEIEPGTPIEKRILLASLVEKFNPNQPRYPKGHPLGGKWMDAGASATAEVGDRIAPHYEKPYTNPSGRGGAPENFDATRMSSMPEDFRADIERRFREAGIEPVPDALFDNLDMLMERIKSEHPDLVELGKDWYGDAQNRIAEHAAATGTDLETAIGMTAAMSPNSEWGQNIALAGEAMRQLKADDPIVATDADMEWLNDKAAGGVKAQNFRDLKARLDAGENPRLSELDPKVAAVGIQLVARRRELVSENPTGKGTFGKVAFATGTNNIGKAVMMYRGADPDDVLGGHKVRSFFNNLSDPYDTRGSEDVTIDTHAASAAQLFRMPMDSARADKTVWNGSNKAANQVGAYAVYADAFRQVARKHGMTTNQAQAVLWIGWQQVRHEYPGIVVSEDAKTVAAGLRKQDVYGPARASTVGRYGLQTGESGAIAPPRYKSQVSAWKQYRDGKMSWADYQQYLERTPA